MTEQMRFDDLAPQHVEVYVGQKKYYLCEPSEDAVCKFRNAVSRETKWQDGKLAYVGNMADTEPMLVSMCLYRATDDGSLPVDGNGRPDQKHLMALSAVRSWPARIVSALYKKARTLGNLDEDDSPDGLQRQIEELQNRLDAVRNGEGVSSKNVPEPTTGTSI